MSNDIQMDTLACLIFILFIMSALTLIKRVFLNLLCVTV